MRPGEELAGRLFVPGSYTTEFFDDLEESFYQIALAVSVKSQSRLILRFALGGMTGLMARTVRLAAKPSES